MRLIVLAGALLVAGCLVLASAEQQQAPASGKAPLARQSSAGSMIGAIGSLVPGIISSVAPFVVLVGLSALMMPALGMGLLSREARRSGPADQMVPSVNFPASLAQYARPLQTSPQDIYYFTKRSLPSLVSSLSSASLFNGMQEVLERVLRAIDNADKRYN